MKAHQVNECRARAGILVADIAMVVAVNTEVEDSLTCSVHTEHGVGHVRGKHCNHT